MDELEVGEAITLQSEFVNAAWALTNPTTVTLTITDPNGNVSTIAQGALTNPSVVLWTYTFTASVAGVYSYRFDGTGTVLAGTTGYFAVLTLGTEIRSGPCSDWCSIDDVRNLGAYSNVTTLPDPAVLRMIPVASKMLYDRTARRFSGICSATVRPSRRPQGTLDWPWYGPWVSTWQPDWGMGSCWSPGFPFACSCGVPSQLSLGYYPVRQITEVKVDGVVLSPTAYRIDDHRWLTRIDGSGWPSCFVAGSLVLTSEGLKPIEDVRAGESVLTHKNRWRRVIASRQTGVEETVTVIGRGGWVQCTPEHQFFAAEVHGKPGQRKLGSPAWARADALVGQAWSSPRVIPEADLRLPEGWTVDELPENFWWVIGRWIGDGWTDGTGGSKSVLICAGNHEADFLDGELARTGWRWNRNDMGFTDRFRFCNAELHAWLREEFGTGAHNKRIPGWLFGAPEGVRQSFVEGYVSADGWEPETGAGGRGRPLKSVHTVSRSLAVGLRLMLGTLGNAATLYDSAALRSLGRKAYRVDWPEGKPGEPYSQAWDDSEHLWGRVRRVELDREAVPVYDLEVDEDHSFVVDGFVVHNCQDLSAAVTAANTFQVKLLYGQDPGSDGALAAAVLSGELALAASNQACRLPRRIVSLTQQGKTMQLFDPTALMDKGLFGIPEIDIFVTGENPHGLRRRASISSPDVRNPVRRAGY